MTAHPSWLGVRQINTSQMESTASTLYVVTIQNVDMIKNFRNVQTVYHTMANACFGIIAYSCTQQPNWQEVDQKQSRPISLLISSTPLCFRKGLCNDFLLAIFPVAIPRLASGNIFPIMILVPRKWFRPLCMHSQCPEKLFQYSHILYKRDKTLKIKPWFKRWLLFNCSLFQM